MIRVSFVVERYATYTDGPYREQYEHPYNSTIEEGRLTFRELIEALQEYSYCSNWPPQGAPYEWVIDQDDDYTSGDVIVKSLHLTDKARARYWRKAILRRFCRVQG